MLISQQRIVITHYTTTRSIPFISSYKKALAGAGIRGMRCLLSLCLLPLGPSD